jgi:hypothetical protein
MSPGNREGRPGGGGGPDVPTEGNTTQPTAHTLYLGGHVTAQQQALRALPGRVLAGREAAQDAAPNS